MKRAVEKLLRVLFPLLALVYLVWRIGWTVPYDHGVLSVVLSFLLLAAELIGIAEMTVHLQTVAGAERKGLPAPPRNTGKLPEVDVFVPTYGEPVALLEQTLTACLAMEYDDPESVHIYLCDDADRDEMQALAERLGVNYLRREEHKGAKAGNLNAAMARSASPLVVVFDADMCPMPHFLRSTVPYFLVGTDKKGRCIVGDRLGYLQTPQQFRNADLFQRVFRAEELIPNEQDYFYRSLEPARNRTNAVIFGGSNTVLLRAALEKAGGFVTESLTEDFATGINIQKQGYACLATPTAMAEGLAPESLSALIRQRSRWARGCIQAGRCTKLMFSKGLSLMQRLNYLISISYWYAPLKRLLYLLTPLLYAVFGITVMRCNTTQLMIFWLPMFLCSVLGIRLTSDRMRTAKWSDIYEFCLFPFLLGPVLAETFGIKKRKFAVTDKSGRAEWRWWYPLPYLVLIALSVIGILRTVGMTVAGRTGIYLLLLFWLVYHLYQLLLALVFVLGCRKPPREKDDVRLVHDLRADRFGRTSLFAIIYRILFQRKTRKERTK